MSLQCTVRSILCLLHQQTLRFARFSPPTRSEGSSLRFKRILHRRRPSPRRPSLPSLSLSLHSISDCSLGNLLILGKNDDTGFNAYRGYYTNGGEKLLIQMT
ncbi:hypothetical protein RIF29_38668 [Crotalaria pallida]|uniref:Uncharacterized protein n=1 Tax=Crotalaria pallida TaxID=3830 RepID=A0AAN9HLS4_CROPI